MKLIEGKKYRITFDNGKYADVTYMGVIDNMNFTCDRCFSQKRAKYPNFPYNILLNKSQRWNCREFVQGDINNPNCSYHYGSECIKKINIVEL